jgi:hypothetical protein
VTGTVTLDGQPLKEGKIFFVEDDGRPPAGADVTNGAFTLSAYPGKKRVQILAWQMVMDTSGMEEHTDPVPRNYLPERFNTKTTLGAEVTEEGANDFKFEVFSK